MASEPDRWAKVTRMPRGGLQIYIPKQELDRLPLDLEEEVFARRHAVNDNGRSKLLITLRNDIPD